jgi:hypothetical protein
MSRATQPLLLHHYTGGTGLIGIFESDSIWATQIQYLNDVKEFVHAIEIAKRFLYTAKQDATDATDIALCVALCEAIASLSQMKIYVTCFSEVEDSLSQWRGYCPPGFGYSIGFCGSELRMIAKPQGFELVQCIYDDPEQQRVVKAWTTRTLSTLRQTLSSGVSPQMHVQQSYNTFLPECITFGAALKDRAFRDEREWRLVSLVLSDGPVVQLRPGRSMLVPYVPIRLDLRKNDSLIYNIRVGPTPNLDLAMMAAAQYGDRFRIKNGIGRSMVPYRDW